MRTIILMLGGMLLMGAAASQPGPGSVQDPVHFTYSFKASCVKPADGAATCECVCEEAGENDNFCAWLYQEMESAFSNQCTSY